MEDDRNRAHRALLETLPLPYVATDATGHITEWNQRYLDLLDLPVERVRGAFLADLLSTPEAREVLARGMGELLAGRRFVEEYATYRPNGQRADFRIHVTPLFDTRGEFAGTQALVEDVTELHKARKALAESEAELRDLYENAPLAYYVISLDARVLRWNGRVAEFFGVDPSVLRPGMDVRELIRPTPEAEAAIGLAVERTIRGESFSIEVPFQRLDGEPRWVRSHVQPLRDARGVTVALGSITEDITDIRRAELAVRESDARLRALFDAAIDGIVAFDRAGTITSFNAAAERLLRCPPERAIGASVFRFATEPLAAALRHQVEAMADGVQGQAFFVPSGLAMRRGDLSEFECEATLSRASADGKPMYLAIFRDVEERRAQTAELERLRGQSEYFREELRQVHPFDEILGRSPALSASLAQVSRVAPTESTVLILGETGTGKELIARALHARSPRAERPLVKLNCAAVPAGLVESELFGHEKGAFTGATERRIGRFELANGGTIFLDEIGELPLEAQAKLLRVLQEREFERVGGSRTLSTDVRVIAATNRDLAAMVEEGRFRSDLYYRLNVFPVTIPPLRERAGDVSLLANLFVARYASKIGRAATRLSATTATRLSEYAWPGNVRELENVIERALILASPDAAELEVPDAVLPLGAPPSPRVSPPTPALPSAPSAAAAPLVAGGDRLDEIERGHILATLAATGWRIEGESGAAKQLGLRPSTLRSRMQKLGIRRER